MRESREGMGERSNISAAWEGMGRKGGLHVREGGGEGVQEVLITNSAMRQVLV